MKLLLLDQFSELGGAQRMLLDLLEAVRDRGWQAVVGAPGRGRLIDRAAALGFEVAPIRCGPYASGRKSAADALRFAGEIAPLSRQIREAAGRFQPDLVYLNGPRLLPAAGLARLGHPVLFHAHIRVSQRAARLVAGLSLRFLDAHLVAVCRDVAEDWKPFVGESRISVIYNGVAGPEREIARNRAGPPLVGCIGRIAPEKGQLEFLQAAAQIRTAVPGTRFVIAGAALFPDRTALSYERQVREAAASLPVEFTGWTEDVYGVLERLRLLLVPSMWPEPNPRVILEALAAGVPVVAFRVGGIPEIVEHGRTGFLCDTAAEMARLAIELLNSDPARLCAVSQAARETWSARFTLPRWRQQMIEQVERQCR